MLNLEIDEFQNVINGSRLSLRDLLVVLLLIAISFCLRAYRWMYMLDRGDQSKESYVNFSNFLFGLGLNILLPLRLGDIYRISKGKNLLQAASGFVVEKFTDLTILAQLLMLVVILHFTCINLPLGVLSFLSCLILAFFPGLFLRPTLKLTQRITFLRAISPFIEQILAFRGRIYRNVLILTYIAWFVEACAFMFVAASLTNGVLWLDGFNVFPISTLSTMIPSSPGFIGTFDLATSSFLESRHWGRREAMEFTVMIHAILIVASLGTFLFSFLFKTILNYKNANI